jgi:hypothetical protein
MKHLSGHVTTSEGNLTEEKSCVNSNISDMVILAYKVR